MNLDNVPEEVRRAIEETRADNADLINEMPNKATSAAQRILQAEHGTPREFAQACVNAIGEITCLEAHTAIQKYRKQWEEAS
jgi:hypothetical protein